MYPLFKQVSCRQLVAVKFPALFEQCIGISGLTRASPCAGVGYHYPAFAVREIFYEGSRAGKCSGAAPSFFRCGVVPSQSECILVEIFGHLCYGFWGNDILHFRLSVYRCYQTRYFGR